MTLYKGICQTAIVILSPLTILKSSIGQPGYYKKRNEQNDLLKESRLVLKGAYMFNKRLYVKVSFHISCRCSLTCSSKYQYTIFCAYFDITTCLLFSLKSLRRTKTLQKDAGLFHRSSKESAVVHIRKHCLMWQRKKCCLSLN